MTIPGLGGQVPPRADQQYPGSGGVVVAPGSTNIVRATQVVVFGTGAGTGLFVYNGTPALGNAPIFAVVAPGTVLDPFGNAVQTLMNVGSLAGAHAGFDTNGVEYLSDSTGTTRIMLDPQNRVIEFYDSLGTGHNAALITIASAAGSDRFTGLAFPAGINLAGLPLQAGTTLITTQGILTYSSLPPALGGLTASSNVPTQFTDSAGNTVLSGDTSYVSIGGSNVIATSAQAGALIFALSTTGAGGAYTAISTLTVSGDGDMHYSASGTAHMVADTLWFGKDPTSGVRGLWNDMRPLANSFVGTIAGQYPPQYRYTPDGYVEVAGYVQFPAAGGPNFNSVTFATLPAGFRPAANAGHRWPITLSTNVTPVGVPAVQIDTSGNLQFHNCPASGMTSNVAGIYGSYPLNSPIAS